MTTTLFTGNETNARHAIMQHQSEATNYAWLMDARWYRTGATGKVIVILKD